MTVSRGGLKRYLNDRKTKNTVVIYSFASCHVCACQVILFSKYCLFYMLSRCDMFVFMCMIFLSLASTHFFRVLCMLVSSKMYLIFMWAR